MSTCCERLGAGGRLALRDPDSRGDLRGQDGGGGGGEGQRAGAGRERRGGGGVAPEEHQSVPRARLPPHFTLCPLRGSPWKFCSRLSPGPSCLLCFYLLGAGSPKPSQLLHRACEDRMPRPPVTRKRCPGKPRAMQSRALRGAVRDPFHGWPACPILCLLAIATSLVAVLVGEGTIHFRTLRLGAAACLTGHNICVLARRVKCN